MAERPPPGYERRDKPLQHDIKYQFYLGLQLLSDSKTMITYLRHTKEVIAPDLVIVNPKHANFVVESGAMCQPESIVKMATIITKFSLTRAYYTDNLKSLTIMHQNIHTQFENVLDEFDSKTGATIKSLLQLTAQTNNQDITPTFENDDLPSNIDHPLSTVNKTELFSMLNLNVDAKMENVVFDIDEYWDAVRYYTNGGLLKSLTGKLKTIVLNDNKPSVTIFERKFLPKNVQFMHPYTYFGKRIVLPLATSEYQTATSDLTLAGTEHVEVKSLIRYGEWNRGFHQEMM